MACAISRRLRASHDGTVKEQGHDVTRRDVIELVSEMVDRGAPVAANKTLQMAKTFFTWCVGKAIIDRSPCEGVKQPTREIPRDRVLSDDELGRVIRAARQIAGPYGGIVELLALTAQRREEVAQMTWDELDQVWTIPGTRAKNGKPHKAALGLKTDTRAESAKALERQRHEMAMERLRAAIEYQESAARTFIGCNSKASQSSSHDPASKRRTV